MSADAAFLDEAIRVVEANSEALAALPTNERLAIEKRVRWLAEAHDHQISPSGDWWAIWLLLAGRGAGKTRVAAEEIWWQAWSNPGTRWLVAAPTASDLIDVCFEGESGIRACMPPELEFRYVKSPRPILKLKNGSMIYGIPASEPERFRGPQFHGGWFDELAAWEYLDAAWDMIQFGMRLGTAPRQICTTTPRPKPLIIDLVNRDGKDVAVTKASTYSNLANLAKTFRDKVLSYEGTKLGRQEIHAEIIDPEEAGVVKRAMLRLWPNDRPLPIFQYILQSYDCATSDKTQNDPTACTTWGVFKPDEDSSAAVMLIDAWSDYLKYPDLRPKVVEDFEIIYGDPDEFGNGKKVDLILIEDKSAGTPLIQDLQRAELPARPYNPGNADKYMRLSIASPVAARGKIYIPETSDPDRPGQFRDWAEEFVAQLCAFPEVRHDDYVDTFSQAMRYLRDAGYIRIDPLPPVDDKLDPPKNRGNPYAQ